MPTLHGRGGMVYLAPNATAAAEKIGEARSWRIDVRQLLVENTQGFGIIWQTYLLAATGWRGNISGNLDTSQSTAFRAANPPAEYPSINTYGPVRMYLYPDAANTSRYYYGTAWPDITVEATLRNVVRFSLDFTGHGDLTAV